MSFPTVDELRSLLADAAPDFDASMLPDDASLADAGLDSLDKVTFILKVEERANTRIPDEDYGPLDTLRDIARYVADGAA